MASWLPGRPEEGEMTQTMPAAMDGTTLERLTVPRSVPRRRSRRFAAAAAVAVVGLLLYSSAAHATPGKSSQWITLTGTCDGIPTVVLDPPGPGPTGFSTLTGKMGVGRLFQSIYAPTGEVVFQQEYGSALAHANQPVSTCDFPVPPEFSPDGTTNWIFRVTGFFRD
jgi:hypothetical protein